MKRITRWSPDTCSCILEYEWDDAEDAGSRQHTLKAVLQKCPNHISLSDAGIYNEVISENTRKNGVFAETQKVFPSLTTDDYNWSLDDKRKLKVGFLNLSMNAMEKQQLITALENRFGKEKVEVI